MAQEIAIVDTMVLATLIQPGDTHPSSAEYGQRIGTRPVVVSFVTLAELRYGALKANWVSYDDEAWNVTWPSSWWSNPMINSSPTTPSFGQSANATDTR